MMNMDFTKTYFNCKCNKTYFTLLFLETFPCINEKCVYMFFWFLGNPGA